MIQIITFIITETGERRTGASTECRLNASNATHSIPYTLFVFYNAHPYNIVVIVGRKRHG